MEWRGIPGRETCSEKFPRIKKPTGTSSNMKEREREREKGRLCILQIERCFSFCIVCVSGAILSWRTPVTKKLRWICRSAGAFSFVKGQKEVRPLDRRKGMVKS